MIIITYYIYFITYLHSNKMLTNLIYSYYYKYSVLPTVKIFLLDIIEMNDNTLIYNPIQALDHEFDEIFANY